MADTLTISLTGADELARNLNELTQDLRKKVLRAAMKDAAKPIIAAAKQNARVLRNLKEKRRQPGVMRKNIRVANSKKYRGADGVIGVFISVRATTKARRAAPVSGDPFYYRFVEGGHRIVARRARGALRLTQRTRRAQSSGAVPAYPFLAPAFAAQGQTALRILQQRIAERIALTNAKR